MSGSGGSWRVAGRLARREVRRHPWRHLLVTGLILVPVLAALAAFSAITTYRNGEARTASFRFPSPDAVHYTQEQWPGDPTAPDLSSPKVAANLGLPAGTRTEVARSRPDWFVGDRSRPDGHGPLLVGSDVYEAGAGSAGTSRFVVEDGRMPRTADEIFLTTPAAEAGGWSIGDTVMSARSGRPFAIVGTGVFGTDTRTRVAAVADLPAAYWTQSLVGLDSVLVGDSYPHPVASTQELTAWVPDAGLRHDLANQSFAVADEGVDLDGRVGAGLTMAAAAICAVVAVVASAALAISSRKQLRTIGLLSTVGTDPATIRRAMLLQGAIPGLIAGLVAITIATVAVATANAVGLWERVTHVSGAQVALSPGGSVIVVVLGVASGIAAAWQPARTSSRIPTLSALAGRRPLGPVPSRVPVGGAILWGCGAAALVLAFGSDRASAVEAAQPFLIIGGVAALALGGVGLAPAIVALLDPIAGRFRGTWRMGLRGLARHRMQSAATVAAIGVVLAVPVGLLTTRNVMDERDARSAGTTNNCCVTATTALPAAKATPHLLLGEHGGTRIAVQGGLRTPAAAVATADVHDLLGPTSAVIRTVPLVDQDGRWRKVATVDEAVAAQVLEPAAARAIAEGRAIAFDAPTGPVAFTAAGDTASFEAGSTSADVGFAPFDFSYLVGTAALGEVGAERPADNITVVRAGPMTDAERSDLRDLNGFRSYDPAPKGPPTLAQVQRAAAAGAAQAEGAAEVAIELVSDGRPPRQEYHQVVDQSTPHDEWNKALLAMAIVSGALALLVLTITLSLRAVDGEADRRAAFAAGVAPAALRHQRAFEGVVLALLGATLAIPLGWIPVTAASLGADQTGPGGLRSLSNVVTTPGWAVVPILLVPAIAAAVLWTILPAITAAVRTARHRDLPDDLIPRW